MQPHQPQDETNVCVYQTLRRRLLQLPLVPITFTLALIRLQRTPFNLLLECQQQRHCHKTVVGSNLSTLLLLVLPTAALLTISKVAMVTFNRTEPKTFLLLTISMLSSHHLIVLLPPPPILVVVARRRGARTLTPQLSFRMSTSI